MKLNHMKTISTFDSLVSIVPTKLNQNKFVHFEKVNNLGFECCIGKLYIQFTRVEFYGVQVKYQNYVLLWI